LLEITGIGGIGYKDNGSSGQHIDEELGIERENE
jgi:hypothetical protein